MDAEGAAGGTDPDLLSEREDSQAEAEQGIISGQRRCSSRGLGNHTKDAPPSCVSGLEVSPLLGDRTFEVPADDPQPLTMVDVRPIEPDATAVSEALDLLGLHWA